jgi:hypothetical protein
MTFTFCRVEARVNLILDEVASLVADPRGVRLRRTRIQNQHRLAQEIIHIVRTMELHEDTKS